MYLKMNPDKHENGVRVPSCNKLVHVLYNEVMHPILKNEDALAGKLKRILQISLNNSCGYPYFHVDNYTEGFFQDHMTRLYELGYENAVIWFEGNWPRGQSFEDELVDVITNTWDKTKWLAAGHILHRGTDAPQWHEQCIVLNLRTFVPVSRFFTTLTWKGPGGLLDSFKNSFVASTEHMHDDYTPLWVSSWDTENLPDNDRCIAHDPPLSMDNSFFNILFPVAFNRELIIYNLPYNVREEKNCCYIEDDLEFTKEWFFDYDFNTRLSLDESRSYGYERVHEDKNDLFQYKVMDTHIMYVTNTETVPADNNIVPIDTLVVPCSGLHQYKHISNNRDTIKRILWTDFSPFGIGWQEFVLKNWDGKDFDKFYKDNFNVITDLGLPSEEFINYDEQNTLDFIESYENEEDWLEHWDFIRTLDHQFVKIDVVKEWKRLSELVGKDHSALLQLSNIWQYEINYVNSPDFDAQLAFLNLFNELLKNNKNIYFSGDTPGGEHYHYKNMRTLPGIF